MSRGLAAADLDADRVDQDQVLQTGVAGDREFRRDPAAETEAGDGHATFRQVIQHVEVEVYKIVHRIEVGRQGRGAETRMRGRDDIAGAREVRNELAPCGLIGLMPWISRMVSARSATGAQDFQFVVASFGRHARWSTRRQVLQLRQHVPGGAC